MCSYHIFVEVLSFQIDTNENARRRPIFGLVGVSGTLCPYQSSGTEEPPLIRDAYPSGVSFPLPDMMPLASFLNFLTPLCGEQSPCAWVQGTTPSCSYILVESQTAHVV